MIFAPWDSCGKSLGTHRLGACQAYSIGIRSKPSTLEAMRTQALIFIGSPASLAATRTTPREMSDKLQFVIGNIDCVTANAVLCVLATPPENPCGLYDKKRNPLSARSLIAGFSRRLSGQMRFSLP